MAVAIITGFNQINQLRNNANLSQGKGVFDSWTYMAKANISVGQVAGNLNTFPTGVNLINDVDLIDSVITDAGLKSPVGPSIIEVI
ncbi:hypothetical protein Tfer_0623 [Thermincola ferriacetica]|uniref:Uncharacterized protein n=1 Tax=Thermincola ferriacetica TaxID=281456 RepID=A0A0L6W4F4_9FIRM|nr:hypothetical protein [Thermincola ferriacetica]KNZ70442.1 hypothetical protein Tfer_0623 [Thermincola ferriacetica]